MGVYDMVTLPGGPEGAQVKCWGCQMKSLGAGSRVGEMEGHADYAVALREGGYAVVRGQVLDEWVADAPSLRVFDKWGAPFGEDSAGLLGDAYFGGQESR